MSKKKKGNKMIELQTRNLPLDLFDIEDEELEDGAFEYEEKFRKVRHAHERFWDDEG